MDWFIVSFRETICCIRPAVEQNIHALRGGARLDNASVCPRIDAPRATKFWHAAVNVWHPGGMLC